MTGLAAARRVVSSGPRGPARDAILAFLDRHPDALSRSCRAGHLTASAAVVAAAGDAVLLVRHRKFGRWLQPGGHADGDADLARVALGEAVEETGVAGLSLAAGLPVDLDVHEVADDDGAGTHLHLDVRFVVVAPGPGRPAPRPSERETAGAAWFDPARLPDGVDAGLARLVAAAVAAVAAALQPAVQPAVPASVPAPHPA